MHFIPMFFLLFYLGKNERSLLSIVSAVECSAIIWLFAVVPWIMAIYESSFHKHTIIFKSNDCCNIIWRWILIKLMYYMQKLGNTYWDSWCSCPTRAQFRNSFRNQIVSPAISWAFQNACKDGIVLAVVYNVCF